MSAEDAITQALLRWAEPVSRHARAIAKAALAALDGNAYTVEPAARTTTSGPGMSCEVHAEPGRVLLVLPRCPCCGSGTVSVAFQPVHADSLGTDLQAAAAQAAEEAP